MEKMAFQSSHKWISFNLNLSECSPELWLLLGEAQSKCQHISSVPLEPQMHKKLNAVTLARGVRATTAIEGNTLSERDVLDQVEGRTPQLPPSKQYQAQETQNIIDAFNDMIKSVIRDGFAPLNRQQLLNYNQLVLKNLELSKDVVRGQIRKHDVGVGSYRAVPWRDCEFLLDRLCRFLNEELSLSIRGFEAVAGGILKSIVAHLYIAWIHPFGDGNGRVARLLETRILMEAGVPVPASHLMSDHYNETRSEYYRHLDLSSQKEYGYRDFIIYALRGFVDKLKEHLDQIQSYQRDVIWKYYVHEQVKREKSSTSDRKRHLALAISESSAPVSIAGMMMLDEHLIREYKGKTMQAVKRDLHWLVEQKLVKRVAGGYVPNIEILNDSFIKPAKAPTNGGP